MLLPTLLRSRVSCIFLLLYRVWSVDFYIGQIVRADPLILTFVRNVIFLLLRLSSGIQNTVLKQPINMYNV